MANKAASQEWVRGVTHMPVKADEVGVRKIAKLLRIAISKVADIVVDESWRLLISFGRS